MKQQKWIIAIGIIVAIGFILFQLSGLMFTSAVPVPHSVSLNKEVATKLVIDFRKYGKIHELDDCTRSYKSINGIAISMNQGGSEGGGKYFKEVLKEQKISESDFEVFRKALEETKLRQYIKTNEYSVFIVDGFLDNVWGYLYAHKNREIGEDYFDVDIYTIKAIEDLGDNWYRIAGS